MAMTPKERAKYSPKWIHFVVPTHTIPKEFVDINGNNSQGGLSSSSSDLSHSIKALSEKVLDVDTRLLDLTAKLDRIESLLVANAVRNQ